MKKHLTFYHVMVQLDCAMSGETQIVVDDYFTPEVVKDLQVFKDNTKQYLDRINNLSEVKEHGGHYSFTIDTCTFNNGWGRSLKAQSNHQSYQVKDVLMGLESLGSDGATDNAIQNSIEWLRNQQPPF